MNAYQYKGFSITKQSNITNHPKAYLGTTTNDIYFARTERQLRRLINAYVKFYKGAA